jgi:hypothetical protein
VSRELPRRPSLDHLKKQAKERLRELRLRQPEASLADAQHALAREYGFESWPRLKAYVESAAATPARPPAFHRLTHKARQALFFSRFEAAQAGSPTIEPGHMLLALLRVSRDVPRNVFAGADIPAGTTRARLAPVRPGSQALPATAIIPFGERTTQVVIEAIAEADAQRHERVGLAHLVLGILHDRESAATSVLHDAGMRIDMVRHVAAASVEAEPDGGL